MSNESDDEFAALPRRDLSSTRDLSGGGGGDGDSFDENPNSTSRLAKSRQARQEMRRQRKLSNSTSNVGGESDLETDTSTKNSMSGLDTESRRDGRQGPRSPLRSSRILKDGGGGSEAGTDTETGKATSKSSKDSGNKENIKDKDKNRKGFDLAQLLDEPLITTTTAPMHVALLVAAVEEKVIVIPKGTLVNAGDDIKTLICQFCSKILDPVNCFSCSCGGFQSSGGGRLGRQEGMLSELDILKGDGSKIAGLNNLNSSETDALLGFSAHNFLGTDVAEMDYVSNRDDGLYKPQVMGALDKLLTGEMVDNLIPAAMSLNNNASSGPNAVKANIQLSRITQRMLREEEGYREEVAARVQLNEKFPTFEKAHPTSSPFTAALASLAIGPVFRAIEDPIDNVAAQPLLPAVQKGYGGVLGDWNVTDMGYNNRGGDVDLGSFVAFSDDIDDKNRSRVHAKLHLHRLNIIDHPLFSEEDRICVTIRRQYMQYKSLLEQQNVDHYTMRILNAYSLIRKILDDRAKSSGGALGNEYMSEESARNKLETLYTDLLESFSVLADVRNMLESLTNSILDAWVRVRNIRETKKFNSTKLNVDAKRLFVGESEDNGSKQQDGQLSVVLASWRKLTEGIDVIKRDLDNVFEILYRPEVQSEGKSAVEVSKVSEKKKRSKKTTEQTSTVKDALTAEDIQMRKLDRVVSEMRSLEKYSLPLPSLIIRVSETENVLSYVSDFNEMKRRKIIYSNKMKVVVKVDGEIVTSSMAVPILFPAWHCDFNQHFDLFLLSKPKNIALDIVLVSETSGMSCLSTEETLGTVFVPMSVGKLNDYKNFGNPNVGIATHSMTPIVGWFTFASQKVFSDPFSPAFANQPLISLEDFDLPGAAIQGAILCSVEFESSFKPQANALEGVHPNQVARIQGVGKQKESGIEMQGGAANRSNSSLNIDTVALEQDFQSLLPDAMLLDPNDPRNDTILYSMVNASKTAAFGDMFQLSGSDVAHFYSERGESYSNFMKFNISSRLRLLMMRNKKSMSAFTQPIPLSDALIESDDVYKEILANQYESDQKLIQGIAASLAPSGLESTMSQSRKLGPKDDDQAILNRDRDFGQKKETFLEHIRKSNLISDRASRRRPTSTTSVVHENKVYRDFEIFQILVNLFPDVKRSLKPTIQSRVAQSINVPSCDVLVQVIGAKNIPLRDVADSTQNPTEISRRMSKSSKIGGAREDPGYESNSMDRGSSSLGTDAKTTLDKSMLDTAKLKEKQRARTFVRVSFQMNNKNTSCIEGPSPLWKQSLGLPFVPPNDDFSPSNVSAVQDEITFILFDEVPAQASFQSTGGGDEGRRSAVEKRFIGHFSVPFATIFRENRIEGVFRLDTPLFNVGYGLVPNETTSKPKPFDSSTSNYSGNMNNPNQDDQMVGCIAMCCPSLYECAKRVDSLFTLPQLASAGASLEINSRDLIHPDTQVEFAYFVPGPNISFIRLMMTLDPLLLKPPKVDFELSRINTLSIDRGFVSYTKTWIAELQQYSAFTKERHYQPFVNNSDGMSVFLSRYLAPLRPPAGFESKRATLHLVSLLPFLSDGHTFTEAGSNGDVYEDCWCNVQQTLALGSGDEEEHGCLLYNFWYFLIHYSQLISSGGGNLQTENDDDNNKSRSGGKNSGNSRKASNYPSDEFVGNESLFLVLGDAIPEGDSVYILYRDSRRKRASSHSMAVNGGSVSAGGIGGSTASSGEQSGISALLSAFLPTLNYAATDDAAFTPDNFLLVNPCTGYMYSAADQNCPLKTIHTVATPYNVWANIQHTEQPNQMNFNVRNTVHWRPFFGLSFPYPSHGLSSIQMDPSRTSGDIFTIPFRPSADSDAVTIENGIKNKITNSVRTWRSRSKELRLTTTFHSDASNLIAVMLPQLEGWKRTGTLDNMGDVSPREGYSSKGNSSESDMEAAMKIIQDRLYLSMSTILKTRILRGVPINTSYTDIASVEAKIKSLCIHEVRNPEVQFVLAVRVFPLCSGLFSVWIFFGTLEPK